MKTKQKIQWKGRSDLCPSHGHLTKLCEPNTERCKLNSISHRQQATATEIFYPTVKKLNYTLDDWCFLVQMCWVDTCNALMFCSLHRTLVMQFQTRKWHCLCWWLWKGLLLPKNPWVNCTHTYAKPRVNMENIPIRHTYTHGNKQTKSSHLLFKLGWETNWVCFL